MNNSLCVISNSILLYFCKYHEFDYDKIAGKNRGGIDQWFKILYKSNLYPHVNNRVREKMQKFVFSYQTHDIHLTASFTLLTRTNDLHKLHRRRFKRYCRLKIFYKKENWYWWDKVTQFIPFTDQLWSALPTLLINIPTMWHISSWNLHRCIGFADHVT